MAKFTFTFTHIVALPRSCAAAVPLQQAPPALQARRSQSARDAPRDALAIPSASRTRAASKQAQSCETTRTSRNLMGGDRHTPSRDAVAPAAARQSASNWSAARPARGFHRSIWADRQPNAEPCCCCALG